MGTQSEKPLVLIHLSDLHIGATRPGVDPLARFKATVAAVRRLPDQPDAIVVSGDLGDHGSPDEYAIVAMELADLGIPVHVVPGNHDDRMAMRGSFGRPGNGAGPLYCVAEIGPSRLFLLDSTIPGEHHGDLDRRQLDWLETNLAAAPERPALLVMHHPPVRTGVATLDKIGLSGHARLELDRIISRHHSQVRATLADHFHRAITSHLGGRAVLIAPGSYTQLAFDPTAQELRPAEDEPPAFLVHRLLDNELVSYVQPVIGARAL